MTLILNQAAQRFLRISNSSSDVVIRPVVDAKDIIFQQEMVLKLQELKIMELLMLLTISWQSMAQFNIKSEPS